MQIKICTIKDIDVLIEVAIKSYMENYTYLWNDNGDWYVNKSFSLEKIIDEISNPNALFYLFRKEEKAVGFMKLNIDAAIGNFAPKEGLELERIYIIKAASGKGYGKSAINFVVDFARDRDKKLVWLKTMDSSPAVDIYKKLGFKIEAGLKLDYQQMRSEYRGMYLMYLTL